MAARSEREVIIDHTLQDEDKLEIAIKVGAAYDDLRGRVILDFLDTVHSELAPRLGSLWKVSVARDPRRFIEKWARFLAADYHGNPVHCRIEVGADEPGYPKMVWLGAGSPTAPELHESMKNVIDEEYAKGRPGELHSWWRYLDKAYANWGDEETTLLLYRKVEAVNYLVDNLVQLARAVEKSLAAVTPTNIKT